MINLVEIDKNYEKEVWDFRNEILEHDKDNEDQFAGCMGLLNANSSAEWIDLCIKRRNGETSSVPSTVYLALDDNKLVGIIDLRHHINHPILGTWGGHTGYSVKPSSRGHGYAKEMLRLVLIKAKEQGIKNFLITCSITNKVSEAVIKANGGEYESTICVDDTKIKRYWINL